MNASHPTDLPVHPAQQEVLGACPLCESDLAPASNIHHVEGWRIVACPGCGVGITNPRPTLEAIGQFYRSSFFSTRPDDTLRNLVGDLLNRRTSRKQAGERIRSTVLNEIKFLHDWTHKQRGIWRLAFFPFRWALALTYEPIQWLPSEGGRLLDIGFGRGEFLHRAKRLGWDAHGVEVSETSVEWGRSLGCAASRFDGSFQNPLAYPDSHFDLVSANSVLEHVHHPRAAVREMRRLLRPGGRLFLMVPNFECRDIEVLGPHWRMWSPPQHLFHFTAANVRDLLLQEGFSDVVVRYKVWFNPLTDKKSLESIKPTLAPSAFRKLRRHIRFGKRLDFLLGRRSAAEVAPGMALEARAT
ncbi:MAG: class I SAM-dependent methyltransferase [Opitutaceae bacterium]|nr:class I SAM-dependent methyltransferase [Opitutaceae bacterium]